jgi:hypothetical protein
MLPKLMLEGVTVSWPGSVPVPERDTDSPELALFVIPRLPVALPPDVGAKATLNVTLCPAARLRGGVMPLKLNSVPLALICEMVRDEPPEFVSVSESEALVPAGTLPKIRLAGLAASWPGVVPVPASGTLREGFDALEVTVRPPLMLAADVGKNATVKLTLWPGFKVTGKLKPVALKLEVAPAAEIVTLAPPEFVRVSARVWLLPTRTLPNPRLAGLAVSRPGVTPVPDSGTFSAGLDAFEVMARLPVTPPAEVGVKVALKLTLCPGLNVTGKVTPLALKPEVAPIVETVTLAPPEFVSVSARV